ncbi:hypothetical protein [Hoyosella altamirensis]|uniref:Uncharacterized protein n=1 Tax=Hoyosella altamirensis TaxID=616997 RepID=A0A839RV30_9ACTN|nr:hypothetical protein [Hoyosella altamirensis]MBB3040078.1 hypothetical protein [Hoyosella altamirensis]
MSSLDDKERELMDVLRNRVHHAFMAARKGGVPHSAFDDAEALAEAMIAALPSSHVFDRLVGPFYDTAGLVRWLGTSRQAIAKRVHAGSLIACQLEDRQWVYPVWQFTSSGALHPGLNDVWKVLRAGADPWTCAVWMCAENEQLGETAVEAIRAGRTSAVLELAHVDAARWGA